MKIKVLKSKNTKFPSWWTPVTIMVKGEEEKGLQKKGLNVRFTKVADKKLPVGFKGGILVINDGNNINFPYVYQITKGEDGEDVYPVVWIRDFDEVLPLPQTENTCHFDGDDETSEEIELPEEN